MAERNEVELLRRFQETSSWPKTRLAREIGVHIKTLEFWFAGKNNPSPMARERIKAFLTLRGLSVK